MESFSICCTTCQARLRVRDSAAVGQILACPKCGSMILVEAPAVRQSARNNTQTADSVQPPAAVIGSSFDHVDELLADPAPQDRADSVAPETARSLGSAEEVAEPSMASSSSELLTPGPEIHASPSMNRWLTLGVGSLVGVTLAVGGLGYVLARINAPRKHGDRAGKANIASRLSGH